MAQENLHGACTDIHQGRTTQKTNAKLLFLWCRLPESNWRPTAYKAVALPTELNRQRREL
jgi:hypothetical protein